MTTDTNTTDDNLEPIPSSQLDLSGVDIDPTPQMVELHMPDGEVKEVSAVDMARAEAQMSGAMAGTATIAGDDPEIKAREAQEAYLTRNGLGYERKEVEQKLDDGRVVKSTALVINSIPEDFQQLLTFFIDDAPCWFTGCEELRQLYKAELDEGEEDCTTCHKGSLIRKYIELAKKAINEDKMNGVVRSPEDARMDRLRERIRANNAISAQREQEAIAASQAHTPQFVYKAYEDKKKADEAEQRAAADAGSGAVPGSAESGSSGTLHVKGMLRKAAGYFKKVFSAGS